MKFRFSLRQLLILIVAIGVGLACLRGESPSVVGATLFCCASLVGLLCLFGLTVSNLQDTVRAAARQRSWHPMAARAKWLALDTLIIIWSIAAIAVANYVLKTQTGGAGWMLLFSIPVGWWLARRIMGGWPDHSPHHDNEQASDI